MPAHKTHLAIALEINKLFNFDNDLIMLGSVLPDLTVGSNHRKSHCRNTKNGLKGIANPKIFLNKYIHEMDNPIIFGYLIHLLTDEFFNKYLYKNYYIYDDYNNNIGLKINGCIKYMDKKNIKKIKHKDFKLYDKYLLYRNKIIKFKDVKCYYLIKDMDIAIFDKKRLRKYIKHTNNEINVLNKINPRINKKLKIFTLKELNQQYLECHNYIINFIKNNGLY